MYSIAVIGGGVVGLPTALTIQKNLGPSAKVIIFTDKLSPYTTGDIAAGLWEVMVLQNTPKEKVLKWAKVTRDHILMLWKRGEAENLGISLQPIITLSDEENFQLPEWLKITLGHKEISQEQIQNYNKQFGKKFTGGYTLVSFTWEASKFLPKFKTQFLENGGEIHQKTIKSFEELKDFDVIVNCTGLNARYLVPDPMVRPIRGQIARVSAQWQFHSVLLEGTNKNYIIPNQNCVILGGTAQKDDYNCAINEEDKNHIFDGCCSFVPGLKNAKVLRHEAGLRPGRDEVRLEVETRRIGDKEVKIVHNYGHGGSGVSLSMGCAEEATELVMQVLGFGRKSKL